MTTTNHRNDSISSNLNKLHEWLTLFHDGKIPSTLNHNPKLNAEIHLAIIRASSEYTSAICDHLFTLHHDVQHRPFVLQFLPSFVTAYYDVLYDHPMSTDVTTKDVCSTIDTFLVSLYNLGVTDDTLNEKIHEFRIPNLTLPSIYHTPNSDHYTPTPLTQQAISKHETKCEVIRLQSFTPFDTINGSSREQILWFLLIQYGTNISSMDQHSRQSYIQMSTKLLGQGFSFEKNPPSSSKSKSILPPTGRRVHVSNRVMSEILGTLFYLKSNSSDNDANDCMRLLKHRAEYEMYADVILMTESMSYLHEFESQRPQNQDAIGIEIESAPTIDLVRQKRTATTTRSMKNRQRGSTVPKENNINAIPGSPSSQPMLNTADGNPHEINLIPSSPLIDEVRTSISSSIGPAVSTPSSSSPRHHTPLSLTSTQTYFQTIHQPGSSPILPLKTILHNDDDEKDSIVITPPSRTSTIKSKDTIATVRFHSNISDENQSNIEVTYL